MPETEEGCVPRGALPLLKMRDSGEDSSAASVGEFVTPHEFEFVVFETGEAVDDL